VSDVKNIRRRMFYILGKRMEPSKSVHIALQAIFGIGKTKAIRICEQLGLSPSVKIKSTPDLGRGKHA
jgi:ribosomal protein S13